MEGLPGVMPAAVASAASAASRLRRGTRPASELRTGTPPPAGPSASTAKAWLSPRDAWRKALGASCSDHSGAWEGCHDVGQANCGSPTLLPLAAGLEGLLQWQHVRMSCPRGGGGGGGVMLAGWGAAGTASAAMLEQGHALRLTFHQPHRVTLSGCALPRQL